MANSQTAFMERDLVPDRKTLQEAVKLLKFRLAIDAAYVPFECSGYIPCTLDGEDSGFDLRFDESSGRLAPHLQSQLGARDVEMIFRWGGDPREYASAMIVSAALANAFGALVLRPGEEAFRAGDRLTEEARKAFEQSQE